MTKYFYTFFAALLVSGRAMAYQPNYIFNEILVVNNSNETIRNVTLRDEKSGQVYECGDIAPLGICSNRFGKRRYAQNPIQIEWAFGGNTSRVDEFVIQPPAYHVVSISMIAVLEISEQGTIEAYFDQDTPI